MEALKYVSTVTQKGQVTIPAAVRKALGVKPYERVTFRVANGHVELLASPMTLEAAFGAVKVRRRPQDWKRVRSKAREERARRQVEILKESRHRARS